jgi:hypothetical protein
LVNTDKAELGLKRDVLLQNTFVVAPLAVYFDFVDNRHSIAAFAADYKGDIS